MTGTGVQETIEALWRALGSSAPVDAVPLMEIGEGRLPSCFGVSDLASAATAVVGMAIAELGRTRGHDTRLIEVDRRLASAWFSFSIKPLDWTLPPVWDAVAGDYAARDGWIRIHTNAPHHRAAALAVLKARPDREDVARVVRSWTADALETAIVEAGGCAAAMMSREAWLEHPQGQAISGEALVLRQETMPADPNLITDYNPLRPLAGIRVLDMTRVLAGPVATRLLAGFGAEVLRIDPPGWDEANVAPEVTLGKRCATLDLRDPEARRHWRELLSRADILVSGYRPGALERLGLGPDERAAIRPGLVDICLDAYGWSGPWAGRRGFDSLVQMSTGIAEAGMRWKKADRPVPLPVQALDYATGHLLAAMAIRGLQARWQTGRGSRWRTSLAGMAEVLANLPESLGVEFRPLEDRDYSPATELTEWGAALRLKPPIRLDGAMPRWDRPASSFGSEKAMWL